MAERKIEIDTTGGTENTVIASPETREQKKARRAQVLDRGQLGDRLQVDLPPDLYGEWVPNNTVDVFRKRAMGFEIDEVHARKRAMHDKGDAASYVGDCVFMTCSMEDKEILDEIRKDRYDKTHNPRGGRQKEERDFLSSQASNTKDASIVESKARVARKEDISNALKAATNNP